MRSCPATIRTRSNCTANNAYCAARHLLAAFHIQAPIERQRRSFHSSSPLPTQRCLTNSKRCCSLWQKSLASQAKRFISNKAASEPKLQCTEIGEDGKVHSVNEWFKKTDLIAKVRFYFSFSDVSTEANTLFSTGCNRVICERLIHRICRRYSPEHRQFC